MLFEANKPPFNKPRRFLDILNVSLDDTDIGARFRWLRGQDRSTWYPSARLLRQERFGDWSGALAQLATHLDRLASGQLL